MRPIRCGIMLVPVVALVVGCATHTLVAPAPASRPSSAELPPLVSYLTVPVTISTESLTNELNQRFSERESEDGVFFRREIRLPFRGATAQFGLKRSGAVTVSVEHEQVIYRVPLGVEQGYFDIERCGRILGCRKTRGQFGGAALLTGATRIMVGEDWLLRSKTHLGLTWQEGPWVELEGADTPRIELRQLFDLLAAERIREALERAATRIDTRVSRYDFRKYVELAWQRIQQPYQVLKDPPVWLIIEPISAGIGALQIVGEQVRFQPTIAATMRVQTGDNRPASTPVPLPSNGGQPEGGQLHIQLPLVLDYTYLNQIIRERLAGKSFLLKNGVRITVQHIELSAHGDRVKVETDFSAENVPPFSSAAPGKLFLVGRPVFDRASGQVKVEEFDFEFQTENYLYQTADWLLHDLFVQRIQEKLTFDVSSRIQSAQDKMRDQLSRLTIGRGMALRLGPVEFVPSTDLVVRGTHLFLLLSITGEASIALDFGRLESR